MSAFQRIEPCEVGWQIGTSKWPRGAGDLWVRWERTTGVIGPQGSGKTLGCLIPALLQAPGAALVTLTKPQDMLLSWTARSRRGPCVVRPSRPAPRRADAESSRTPGLSVVAVGSAVV